MNDRIFFYRARLDTFTMTMENFSEAMNWIEEKLAKEKMTDSDIRTSQLLVEELFMRLLKHGGSSPDFSARLDIRKRFHHVNLIFVAAGSKCNPLTAWPEDTEEDAVGYTILRAHIEKMKYDRRDSHQENIICISPHESNFSTVRNVLVGLFVGILSGTLMHSFVDLETCHWIDISIIDPMQTVFISALMMIVAPMIFFSIVAGFSNMSYSTNLGKVGWQLLACSLIKLAFFVTAGLFAGYILGGIPELLPTLADMEASSPTAELSLLALVTGIVPGNVISPFSSNNIMQILFLACFFGVVLNQMDDDTSWAKEGINFLSQFTLKVISVVSLLLPLFVGVSMIELFMNVGLWGLLPYGRLLIIIALGLPLTFFISSLLVAIVARLSPIPFLRKTLPFSLLPFSNSNSNACLPATLTFCTDKLGIHDRITKFSIPIGMQFNMDGIAYYVSVLSMMLACTFSIPIDADFLFSLFLVEFFMALTGVGLLVMPPVLESMGIPATAVMHFIGIEPIMDMPGTAQNVIGNITSALLVARMHDQVDTETYKRV